MTTKTDGPTPFIESNALLAFQADDDEGGTNLLRQLLDNELRSVENAAWRLARTAGSIRQKRQIGTETAPDL